MPGVVLTMRYARKRIAEDGCRRKLTAAGVPVRVDSLNVCAETGGCLGGDRMIRIDDDCERV